MRLGHRDEQRVILVEERRVRRQMRLDERAGGFVVGARIDEAMPREHAPGVGVGDEHRSVSRIEQHRIRRLGAEPRHAQQVAPQSAERFRPETAKPSAEAIEQPARERLEMACLPAIRARRSDDLRERGLRNARERERCQQPPGPKRRDGARRSRPCRVLREHGADGHLVRRSRRPPALRPEAPGQGTMEAKQARFHPITRRARNPAPAREDRRT